MISLVELLKEVTGQPKAIIMAGGAAVGKSTLLKAIQPALTGFENLNADKYVEDKDSPLYNNLAGASALIRKQDLPNTIKAKLNFVYDTTASNYDSTEALYNELINNNYDVMMIMVYAHPIVSFLRNYKRERKVPAQGILGTWANVYNNIDKYKSLFGNNFVLVITPSSSEEESEIKNFEEAYNSNQLQNYFDNLLSTGKFISTFRKPDVNLSPEEKLKKEKSRLQTKEKLRGSIELISNTFENIQNDLLDAISINELPSKVNQFIK